MVEWPEWALQEDELSWVLDGRGRIWATDRAMVALMREGIANGTYATPESAEKILVFATKPRALVPQLGDTRFTISGDLVLAIVNHVLFDARRVLTLEDWFPEPATWALSMTTLRSGRKGLSLFRIDPEQRTLAVLAPYVP